MFIQHVVKGATTNPLTPGWEGEGNPNCLCQCFSTRSTHLLARQNLVSKTCRWKIEKYFVQKSDSKLTYMLSRVCVWLWLAIRWLSEPFREIPEHILKILIRLSINHHSRLSLAWNDEPGGFPHAFANILMDERNPIMRMDDVSLPRSLPIRRMRGSLVPGQCKIYVTESKRTDLPSPPSIRAIIESLGCEWKSITAHPFIAHSREEIFRPTELENPSTMWPPGSGCGRGSV